ncbi:MAG TPA: hypothetical protein DIW23_04680 [Anaerolineae bacterium]|nr:hypothetical protein [Anaerolineae bacterium]
MTLQNFNTFGLVKVERNKITFSFSTVNHKNKAHSKTISSDEISTAIPEKEVGQFLFGISVEQDKATAHYYVTNPIENIEIEKLPLVEKYINIITNTVREFDYLSEKAQPEGL